MPPKRKVNAGNDTTDGTSGTPDADHASNASLLIPPPSAITAPDIEAALSRYGSYVQKIVSKSESKLCELDNWRLNQLSVIVRARDPPYLDKEELQKLMEWKLTRGKFRPALPALIAQNTSPKVKSSTQAAFTTLSQLELDSGDDKSPTEDALKSFRLLLKELCASLKGVGPATASLVLSVYDDRVPFMSDEAYVWAIYADEEARSGKRKLKREIKYTEKGYLDFTMRMWEISMSANRTPAEMEQAAWVLGREWTMGGSLKRAEPGLKAEVVADSKDEGPKPRKSKRQKQ